MSFNSKYLRFALILLIFVMFIKLINSTPTFDPTCGATYSGMEDMVFDHNFSSNMNDPANDSSSTYTYTIFGGMNSSLYPTQKNSSFYNWIYINSSNGVLTINATNDNQTGVFNISIDVTDDHNNGMHCTYYFMINASNDYPNITQIQSEYNLTQNVNFLKYINASDEERHYPLFFIINWTSCNHTSWWNGTGNCSVISSRSISNTTTMFNFTPDRNDVGTYYANISVMDNGGNYTCNSTYCLNNYTFNRTTFYAGLVKFNIFSMLAVNVSDCQYKTYQENTLASCVINITTKGYNDSLIFNSSASIRNYQGYVLNGSWFFPSSTIQSDNYTLNLNATFNLGKSEVGNWSINFTINDSTSGEISNNLIYIYVNRTYNADPVMDDLPNVNTSINLFNRINITVSDDDHFIPDKLQGFNESINFSVRVYNLSSMSQQINLTNFTVRLVSNPLLGTNKTIAKIEFTPNSTEYGNYFVNISARDKQNVLVYKTFNMSINNNDRPYWHNITNILITYENNNTYMNLSMNVSDPNNDTLTFSFTNDTSFPSFNLNSTTGIINFTPKDSDVGQHLVTISISDGFLTNSTVFNFTIRNVNDNPYIEKPIPQSDVYNATVDGTNNIIAAEDNKTKIVLWVQDDDFKIPVNQRSFYNESLTMNISINGTYIYLLNFTKDTSFPTTGNNRSRYEAIFTPNRSMIGFYIIDINFTDRNLSNDSISFNITINTVSHNPVLTNLSNRTSGVNRTFVYNLNASDVEDGYSIGSTNFTFRYNFLSGINFINGNETIFNSSTGSLNITFNSSQAGSYRINITVNDTSGREDSKTFWLYVYNNPTVIYPSLSYTFNLTENTTSSIIFKVNHTIRDNLTYLVYIEDSNLNYNLRYNTTYYGNSTNLTWTFSPNYTDEVHGSNLTLVVYPSNQELNDSISLNTTVTWPLSIENKNTLVEITNLIGGVPYRNLSGGTPYQFILSNYFSDIDAIDPRHNQTIGFKVNLEVPISGGIITYNVTNWTNGTTPMIYFSSTQNSVSNFSITAYEYNETSPNDLIYNITSNIFTLEIQNSSGDQGSNESNESNESIIIQTVYLTSTGGGTTTIVNGAKNPFAFKIITPGKASMIQFQTIKLPIGLENTGKETFNNISMTVYAYRNGNLTDLVKATLDKIYFSSLTAGQKENLTLTLYLGTNKSGDYEILINATSRNPVYSDWGKIYINLQKTNESELKKYLLFTEEFLVQNPNCLELTEMLKDANDLYTKGDYGDARSKAESIIELCKEYVGQVNLPEKVSPSKFSMNEFVIIICFVAVTIGIAYYFYKRREIRHKNDQFFRRKF